MHDHYVCLFGIYYKVNNCNLYYFCISLGICWNPDQNTAIGPISRLAHSYNRLILLLVDLPWSYSRLGAVQKDIQMLRKRWLVKASVTFAINYNATGIYAPECPSRKGITYEKL